jgi:hypothetical protein
MLCVIYGQYHKYAFILSIVVANVITLSVVMLNVVAPFNVNI